MIPLLDPNDLRWTFEVSLRIPSGTVAYSRNAATPHFPAATMFYPNLRHAATLGRVKPSIRVHLNTPQCARRHIQTASEAGTAEAYLEEASPGIHFLSLNRPKAKNAISRRLLQVSPMRMRAWATLLTIAGAA